MADAVAARRRGARRDDVAAPGPGWFDVSCRVDFLPVRWGQDVVTLAQQRVAKINHTIENRAIARDLVHQTHCFDLLTARRLGVLVFDATGIGIYNGIDR